MVVALLLAGLILLFLGGEWLVRGAGALASKLGMSQLLIGLTIVGFGTSMPELLVSLKAGMAGASDIAVGNVVGSNIANVLLILGAAALIYPISTRITGIQRDMVVVVIAGFVLLGVSLTGSLPRWFGGLMVISLISYIAWNVVTSHSDVDEHRDEAVSMPLWQQIAFIGLGLSALVWGADLLVASAIKLARGFALSEAVIGLTIVAVGTSLPELATSCVAAFRKQSEIAIGNVIGSNLFNILGILGVTAIIHPIEVSGAMARVDIPIMISVSVLLFICMLGLKRLSRLFGGVFLMSYAVYCGYLYTLS